MEHNETDAIFAWLNQTNDQEQEKKTIIMIIILKTNENIKATGGC